MSASWCRAMVVSAAVCAVTGSADAQQADAGTASGRRVVVVGVGRPGGTITLHRLGGPGEPAVPLRIQCDAETSAAVGWGSGDPSVSPDGAWVAYTRREVPYVRRLSGGRELLVMPPGRRVDAEVSFTGWSPDSARLLHHLHAASREEGPTPVLPSPAGFYALEVSTMRRTALPTTLESAEGFADDRSVLVLREGGSRPGALVRAPLDGSAAVTLTALPAASLGALDHSAGWVTYLAGTSGHPTGDSRVEVTRFDGTGAREVSPRASWASYQHPRLSPDGAWVVYEHVTGNRSPTSLDLAPTGQGSPRPLTTCNGCRYAWESPTTVLLLEGGALRRVALDGTSTPVATPNVLRMAVAGE